jgi:nucleoid DNA-binding protein
MPNPQFTRALAPSEDRYRNKLAGRKPRTANTVTKKDIAAQMALAMDEKTCEVLSYTKRFNLSEKMIDSFLDGVLRAVIAGHRVELRNFGVFKLRKMRASGDRTGFGLPVKHQYQYGERVKLGFNPVPYTKDVSALKED